MPIQCLYVFTDMTHFTATIFPRIMEDKRKYHLHFSPACYSIGVMLYVSEVTIVLKMLHKRFSRA